jgi:hypothetical protein
MATKFLASATRHALLSDLASNGYEWKDEQGIPRIPEPFEQTTASNGHTAIYLGKVPVTDAVLDEDGNVITPATFSTQFCANVTDTDGQFDTEIEAPETPYNTFA